MASPSSPMGAGRVERQIRMHRLERVIAELIERRQDLATLEYPAWTIRERHEPPAGRPG